MASRPTYLRQLRRDDFWLPSRYCDCPRVDRLPVAAALAVDDAAELVRDDVAVARHVPNLGLKSDSYFASKPRNQTK